MQIREATTDAELENIFPILRELRSTPTFTELMDLTKKAMEHDDFRLVGAFSDGKCAGVMGYRVLYDYAHGKHLYVDDLVVTEAMRSKGVGKLLLEYAEKEAIRLECKGLRLCAGMDNKGSQKFYERSGWVAKSFAYKKSL